LLGWDVANKVKAGYLRIKLAPKSGDCQDT